MFQVKLLGSEPASGRFGLCFSCLFSSMVECGGFLGESGLVGSRNGCFWECESEVLCYSVSQGKKVFV
jgi:hypothetical protein